MNNHEMSTSLSLLVRVKQNSDDQQAWREFAERYGPCIHQWCLQQKLQPNDAEDVTQTVLLKLVTAIRTFEYDPQQTFLGWLRIVTRNVITDLFRARKKMLPGKGGSSMAIMFHSVEAPESLAQRLQDAYDLEIFETALRNIESRITKHRWQAWDLTARQGQKPADVAAQLEMKIASVYTARNQVQAMIRDEVAALQQTAASV